MSLQTIARRYAIALADVVTEKGEASAVQVELAQWGAMIDANALLKEALGNPTVPYEQKRKVLEELIQRSRVRQTTANFLQVLLRNQRLSELNEVNKWIGLILDERSGVVAAEVTTARDVPHDTAEALRNKLTAISGRKVRIQFKTDPELIGGMVARIGSTVYDGSIKNQLREMELKLAGS